jgi:serine/threonine protein kinase
VSLLVNTEPITGYKVTERLGAGGYGEVWKAEAPGGLHKAIKFIYGYLTDEKAARELGALNRIKEIRHPFLLSLERIEVVDGQLLIVTELADESLKDRFQACVETGLGAIPRNELLGYMRDAADALDFLAEKTLQHLDVKPENLLLVGGRVKVADFGLVREIQDRTCSMMGGMTPVYAAPESFDGRPSTASDQYSLAIVYQEMLTGVLPFPGTTAAQLASQHVNARPRLESLPVCDREIIGKALSKSGAERFKNCRALIDALFAADINAVAPAFELESATQSTADRETSPDGGAAETPAGGASVRFTPSPERRSPAPRPRRSPIEARGSDAPNVEANTKSAEPAEQRPVVDLDPFAIAPAEVGLRPTLFVGIGGTGCQILRQLRRRLHDRFGDPSGVPILQLMFVDTDAKSLGQKSRLDAHQNTSAEVTLAVPLRKPQEYRAESLEILQWLSRRWLYNIPRSLQTEGLRPLGRLALVDHSKRLFEEIRKALATITSDAALSRSKEHTRMELRERAPRVFVVGSISGGTGSGMLLDVVYAVRKLLADLGCSDAGVCGVLAHSTQRAASAKSLAIANAYACLSELNHYTKTSYPGEPACGLPAVEHGRARQANTYFVHLGDNLAESDYMLATDAVAEYLYLDAATAAGTFFDKCRSGGGDPPADAEVQLRTLGVCQLAGSQNNLANAAVESACRQLLDRWTTASKKPAATAPDSGLESLVERLSGELKLDARSLVGMFQAAVEKALAPDRRAALERVADRAIAEQAAGPASSYEMQWRFVTQRVRQLLGLADASSADYETQPLLNLAQTVDSECNRSIEALGDRLAYVVLNVADQLDLRLPGALQITDRLLALARTLEGELAGEYRKAQDDLAAHASAPLKPATTSRWSGNRGTGEAASMLARLMEHCDVLANQQAAGAALRLVRGLIHRMSSLSDALVGMRRELLTVASQFAVPRPAGSAAATGAAAKGAAAASAPVENAGSEVERTVAKELESRLSGVVALLEKRVDQEILAPAGGLARLMAGCAEDVLHLPALLRRTARSEVSHALKKIDIAKIVLGPLADAGASGDQVRRALKRARPSLLKCGGAKRMLLVTPQCESAARLAPLVEQVQKEKATVVFDTDCDVVACYEVEQVPLRSVGLMITNADVTYTEAARRLHTRVDVQWSVL